MNYDVRTQTGEVRRVQISRQPRSKWFSWLGFLSFLGQPSPHDIVQSRRTINTIDTPWL